MPRANRRRRNDTALDLNRVAGSITTSQRYAGGEWVVRIVTGGSSGGPYRCPGCQQVLAGREPHVVVWPADGLGGVSDRRHWHRACWQARERRFPTGSYR